MDFRKADRQAGRQRGRRLARHTAVSPQQHGTTGGTESSTWLPQAAVLPDTGTIQGHVPQTTSSALSRLPRVPIPFLPAPVRGVGSRVSHCRPCFLRIICPTGGCLCRQLSVERRYYKTKNPRACFKIRVSYSPVPCRTRLGQEYSAESRNCAPLSSSVRGWVITTRGRFLWLWPIWNRRCSL